MILYDNNLNLNFPFHCIFMIYYIPGLLFSFYVNVLKLFIYAWKPGNLHDERDQMIETSSRSLCTDGSRLRRKES
jgi:hypothetical protein